MRCRLGILMKRAAAAAAPILRATHADQHAKSIFTSLIDIYFAYDNRRRHSSGIIDIRAPNRFSSMCIKDIRFPLTTRCWSSRLKIMLCQCGHERHDDMVSLIDARMPSIHLLSQRQWPPCPKCCIWPPSASLLDATFRFRISMMPLYYDRAMMLPIHASILAT